MFDVPDAETLAAANDVTGSEYPSLYRSVAVATSPSSPTRNFPIGSPTRSIRCSTGCRGAERWRRPPGAGGSTTPRRYSTPRSPTRTTAVTSRSSWPPRGATATGAPPPGNSARRWRLWITEERLSREIRSSMAVERVGIDSDDRPVYVAADALAVDAVLVNRVKAHADFGEPIESGLCEMAAIGLGQTRGAEAAHSAALASGFREVLPDRLSVLLDTVPIAGGIALVENADERLADLRGLTAGEIPEREPAVLERAEGLVGTLPVDPFDLLVLEAIGEDVSGTGMDTSVAGRMPLRGEPDVESPDGARIHIRASRRPATATRPAWEIAD